MVPLIGYTNRLSVTPGETIEFKVSSTLASSYEARLVRVVCGDPNPAGPGIKEEPISAAFAGGYPSRFQAIARGSYARVESSEALSCASGLTVAATIWPTTPGKDPYQGIVSKWHAASERGFALSIGGQGAALRLGHGNGTSTTLEVGKRLRERAWYRVWASWDPGTRTATVGQRPLRSAYGIDDDGNASRIIEQAVETVSASPLLIGALDGSPVTGHYNGKIEHPFIIGRALASRRLHAIKDPRRAKDVIAAWDFSIDIPSQRIVDRGANNLHGVLVNVPTRAMTGSNWNSDDVCWRHAPQKYGAIHFHDDDLHDCGWQTDFAFRVPHDLPSGVYAARLRCGEQEDMIPFFVRPAPGAARSKICVLMPTFTYIVYTNFARGNTDAAYFQRVKDWGARSANPDQHPEYGISTYNVHGDGSGVSYSSRLRPMLTLRSGFFSFVDPRGSGLRHFPGDTHLLDWLEAMGHPFDVVTDEDLHAEGVDLIAGYRAVLTPTHPEYHTTETLDALEAYRDGGGHLVYLGGNGFYWKVGVNPSLPGVVEVRRGEGGMRAWAAEPGEYFNSLDGGYGGLWRRNGRPAHRLVGNGFSGEGPYWGKGYTRTAAAADPRVSWIFNGIADRVIGDFGLGGGGAAGFELDRADHRQGTPANALVIATASGYPPGFMLTLEEWLNEAATVPKLPPEEALRSDMVYFETANGGAVLAVGSITFCGSLSHNAYDNNISKVLDNVVRRFIR